MAPKQNGKIELDVYLDVCSSILNLILCAEVRLVNNEQ